MIIKNIRVINYDTGEILETIVLDSESLNEITTHYTKWEKQGHRVVLETVPTK